MKYMLIENNKPLWPTWKEEKDCTEEELQKANDVLVNEGSINFDALQSLKIKYDKLLKICKIQEERIRKRKWFK